MLAGLHYEDIKASIRKKYKTLSAFERAHGLYPKSVHNHFRGLRNKKVEAAVEQHLRSIISPFAASEPSPPTKARHSSHRLNATAA
ncbi:MAG: hypothetical protein DI568_16050 [Sphingomonas sp.]|nr:MAG: hypothetical protein DI568_16050 [Sphingomonas sp.]